MKELKSNILLKAGIIVILIVLLLIPTTLLKNLITEREFIQSDAINEVSSKWGEKQTIAGPIITIPYDKYVKQYSERDREDKIIKTVEYMHILPDELNIIGNIDPKERYRGIYKIVVYNSNLNFHGKFNSIDYKQFEIFKQHIHFDKAFVSIGISDLKGIKKQVELKWNNEKNLFNPGAITDEIFYNGISCPINIDKADSMSFEFSFDINLRGSQLLYFVPVGKTTDVKISSKWNNPSFDGTFLPDSRQINEKGFTAKWSILNLNRNFPQAWTGHKHNITSSSFGVNLRLPVDGYQKSMRSIKYAILFVSLTFIVFFFVEVLKKVFIHPVQYILVGIALVIFYTLLISMSEHLNFDLAYIISALLTLILITAYMKSVLKINNLVFLVSGILVIMYTFIFVIIQLQGYALLFGCIGLFIILALVMYFSRKIDWYNLKVDDNDKKDKVAKLKSEIKEL